MSTRHFYRCLKCLEVMALGETVETAKAKCAACLGQLEYMGQAKRARLTIETLGCPCDERCTHARGPNCECQCNGANHGSGIVCVIERDMGGVPTLKPQNVDACRRRAAEFDQARAEVIARIKANVPEWDAFCQRVTLPYDRWQECSIARDRLARATMNKTHTGRMKAFALIYPAPTVRQSTLAI